ADLDVVVDSLHSHGAGDLADALVRPVRRGVEIFGTHLCGLDLRQNAAVHEEVVAELLRTAGVTADYAALEEADRVAILTSELHGPRPLTIPSAHYSERTQGELDLLG